jgi:hypothetical protein
MDYPTSLDAFQNPSSNTKMDDMPHATQHGDANDAIEALETKLGTGASVAASAKLLRGTGAGTSAWDKTAPTGDIVGTSDSQTLTNKVISTGSSIDANATVTEILKKVWPIGAIYITIIDTNPATVFGFGTWVAFGAGKTLVGFNSSETEFDTVEETGGAKTHTLAESEMPAHRHQGNSSNTFYDAGTINTDFALKFQTISGYNAKPIAQEIKGSGGAHNNLQPYIVTYMFKRTA